MEQEIRIEKKNHRLNVTVYPDFVEVTVFMSDDAQLLEDERNRQG